MHMSSYLDKDRSGRLLYEEGDERVGAKEFFHLSISFLATRRHDNNSPNGKSFFQKMLFFVRMARRAWPERC